jgi:hypothetical protein
MDTRHNQSLKFPHAGRTEKPMAKVGFEHHGRFNSVSARKMLSCRGARKANLVHKANGWEHQRQIGAFGVATRQRRTAVKRLAQLKAYWLKVFGEPLSEHLAREEEAV